MEGGVLYYAVISFSRSQPMPDEVEYFKKCDPHVPRLKPLSRSDYLGGAGWFPIGTFL